MRTFQPQYIDIVILCGGNVKLKYRREEKLQCMVSIERRPFLSYVIDQISAFGFSRAILAVDSNYHEIKEHIGDRYAFVDFEYSIEDSPLGTLGAAKKAILEYGRYNDVCIVKGNVYTQFDIFDMRNFYDFFELKESLCSLSYDSKDRLEVSPNREISLLKFYNAGFYLINRNELLSCNESSLKNMNIRNHFILRRKKNKTLDINITYDNYKNAKLFFRNIWGYDWSRYEESPSDESIKECLYCNYSRRIIIGKNKYHGWKMKCTLLGRATERRSTCEFFYPRGDKPYTWIRPGEEDLNGC